MLTRPIIFVVLSLLAFMLIYSSYSSSRFWADARPIMPIGCERTGTLKVTCCQLHRINEQPGFPGSGSIVNYCTDCDIGPGGEPNYINCSERYIKAAEEPTPTPIPSPTVPGSIPEDGVLEQPEQPIFGGLNDEGVPPTGGIEQPPAATTQPAPGGGSSVPTEGGSAEQPTAPQDDQDDNQGGGLPPIKNQENVPPGGDVAEQPEDDGQEESSEGEPTAGPLT